MVATCLNLKWWDKFCSLVTPPPQPIIHLLTFLFLYAETKEIQFPFFGTALVVDLAAGADLEEQTSSSDAGRIKKNTENRFPALRAGKVWCRDL